MPVKKSFKTMRSKKKEIFLLCCLRKFDQKFLLYLNSRIVFSFYAFHSTKFHEFYSVSNRKSQHMMNYSQIFYYYYFLTVRNLYPTLAAVYSLRSYDVRYYY